jgi:hypothetical protein
MTILFASNMGQSFVNIEGTITSSTSGGTFDSNFNQSSMYFLNGLIEVSLPSVQSDLWIHYDAEIVSLSTDGKQLTGFNTSANRFDWYIDRDSSANTAQMVIWNGSAYIDVGPVIPFVAVNARQTYDIHYVKHASAGVIELYYNSELLAQATGLDTSNFNTDVIQWHNAVNNSFYLSQVIIADECTICWKLAKTVPFNGSEIIKFVGSNLQALAGAASGTTNIALNSGLTGGLASAVSENDYVVAIFAVSSTADRTLSIVDPSSVPYTLLGTELYANDNYDANLRVAYKKMGSTPDAYVTFGATGAVADAGVIGVYVIRDADLTTFLDAAVTTVTSTNTGNPNPPSVTPVTLLASTLHIGCSAHDGSQNSFVNAPAFVNFVQLKGTGTNSVCAYAGMLNEWTSGAVDPTNLTSGATASTMSTASMSIAIRPQIAAQTFSDVAGASGVNENSGRSAASFVSSPTADQIFRARPKVFTPPSTGYEVKGVAANARVRRGDTGPQSANLLLRSNKTDYHKSDVAVTIGLDPINAVWDTDPTTSAAWTLDNANFALIGVRSRT